MITTVWSMFISFTWIHMTNIKVKFTFMATAVLTKKLKSLTGSLDENQFNNARFRSYCTVFVRQLHVLSRDRGMFALFNWFSSYSTRWVKTFSHYSCIVRLLFFLDSLFFYVRVIRVLFSLPWIQWAENDGMFLHETKQILRTFLLLRTCCTKTLK